MEKEMKIRKWTPKTKYSCTECGGEKTIKHPDYVCKDCGQMFKLKMEM